LDDHDSFRRRFAEFKEAHPGARDLDTSDKDPQGYVNEVEAEFEGHREGSLGIGSLKGQ